MTPEWNEHAVLRAALELAPDKREAFLLESCPDDAARHRIRALLQAFNELQIREPEAARVVQLRYFAGRTLEETAELMGITLAIVRRHWCYAKAWLAQRIRHDPETP